MYHILKSEKFQIIIIFFVALLLRLLYLFLMPQTPVIYDALGYQELGRSILTGTTSDFFVNWGGDIWDMLGSRGPGYASFLTAIFAVFDVDPWPVRYIQVALDALSCVFIYFIGRALVNRYVGLVAAIIAVVYPIFILFTGRILTETLAIFLFWGGLFLLLRGSRLKSWAWLVSAGLLIGAAYLTRPTVLPTFPFLILAVGVTRFEDISLTRRAFLAALFGITIMALLLSWNMFARTQGADPTVGAAGVNVMVGNLGLETNPGVRGWHPDYRKHIDSFWWQSTPVNPVYVAAIMVNFIFYHLWFADNAWWEHLLFLSPTAIYWFQRAVVLSGLGGMGLALTRWRVFAPLFGVMIAFGLVSLKPIEIRHNLLFMPAIFVFAGFFVVSIAEWVKNYKKSVHKNGNTSNRFLPILIVGIALLTLILVSSRLMITGAAASQSLMPPVILGRLGDWVVILLTLLVGGLIYELAQPALGRIPAAIAGFVPSILFVILFGSYIYINGIPRWQAWNADLHQVDQAVLQEIHLPEPISKDKLEFVVWLVDLQTNGDPPPLRVGINGQWLSPQEYSWQRLFCNQKVNFITTLEKTHCPYYQTYADFRQRSLGTWPQWWGIALDPALVLDKKVLSLMLAWQDSQPQSEDVAQVKLGGAFNPPDAGSVVYSPSVLGPSPSEKTSLYRWIVTDEWRMWEKSGVTSVDTRSYVIPVNADPVLLAGDFNIRFIVKYQDGRVVIY